MGGRVQVGANDSIEDITNGKRIGALVVEDVKVLTRQITVDLPKYKDVEQIRFVNVDEKQTKYITKEEETIKYKKVEEGTTKYNTIEKNTIKYIPIEKEYDVERPRIIDKNYERPVLVDKEYVIATPKHIESVRELMEIVPSLIDSIHQLKKELNTLKHYTLVEETLRVPHIKYIPTEVERVVWKDVPRERCSVCGKEV